MRLFLSIAEGPTPAEARPVVATEDPAVLRAAIAALMGRLGASPTPAKVRALASRLRPTDPEPTQ